jgi:hypothetical protein
MRFSAGWIVVAMLVSMLLCACNQERTRRATFLVSGRVTVDGNPASYVVITAHEQGQGANDPKFPVSLTGYTKEDGTFQMNSYGEGDGLPAGEYTLTFFWGEPKGLSLGPDKLKKRYANAAQSKFHCTVQDKAVDLGTISLTTK